MPDMSQMVVVAEPIPIPFDSVKAILLLLSHELAAAATDQATTAANQLVEASAPHWEWFDSGGDVTVVVGDHDEEAGRLTIPIDWTGAKSGRLITGLTGALSLERSTDASSQLIFVGSHQHHPEVAGSDELLGDQVMRAIARSFLAAAAVDLVSRAAETSS